MFFSRKWETEGILQKNERWYLSRKSIKTFCRSLSLSRILCRETLNQNQSNQKFAALRAPSFHFIWGAMRQKMAIFKWENSVAGVQKFSELSFFKSNFIKMFKNLWGAMWPKIVILLKEKWSHMASFSYFYMILYNFIHF